MSAHDYLRGIVLQVGGATEIKPMVRLTCYVCGGDGYVERGFNFGSNVSRCERCAHCGGGGYVWVEEQ